MRLGELLLEQKLVSQEGMDQALRQQVVAGARLGTNLVELNLLEMDVLTQSLGILHQLPAATQQYFDDADTPFQKHLPPYMAARYKAVPLYKTQDGEWAVVAFMDPPPPAVSKELQTVLGKPVFPVIAPELRIHYQLERVYGLVRSNRFKRLLDKGAPVNDRRAYVQSIAEIEPSARLRNDPAAQSVSNLKASQPSNPPNTEAKPNPVEPARLATSEPDAARLNDPAANAGAGKLKIPVPGPSVPPPTDVKAPAATTAKANTPVPGGIKLGSAIPNLASQSLHGLKTQTLQQGLSGPSQRAIVPIKIPAIVPQPASAPAAKPTAEGTRTNHNSVDPMAAKTMMQWGASPTSSIPPLTQPASPPIQKTPTAPTTPSKLMERLSRLGPTRPSDSPAPVLNPAEDVAEGDPFESIIATPSKVGEAAVAEVGTEQPDVFMGQDQALFVDPSSQPPPAISFDHASEADFEVPQDLFQNQDASSDPEPAWNNEFPSPPLFESLPEPRAKASPPVAAPQPVVQPLAENSSENLNNLFSSEDEPFDLVMPEGQGFNPSAPPAFSSTAFSVPPTPEVRPFRESRQPPPRPAPLPKSDEFVQSQGAIARIPVKKVPVAPLPIAVESTNEDLTQIASVVRMSRKAFDRDKLAALILSGLEQAFEGRFSAAMIMISRRGYLFGWKGYSSQTKIENIEEIAFPVNESALFRKPLQTGEAYFGPPTPINEMIDPKIWIILDAGEPSNVGIVPVELAGQLGCVVYVQTDRDVGAPVQANVLELVGALKQGLERLMKAAER